MKFSRSIRSGIAGILALVVLAALWMLIVDHNCSRNVSDDETAGMAILQDVPIGGGGK